jgi:acyl-CoA thioesterase-2
MTDLDGLLAALDLEERGEGHYLGTNVDFGAGSVVYGGQLLAQSLVAGSRVDPDKEPKSIHTVFARGGSLGAPVVYDVDVLK